MNLKKFFEFNSVSGYLQLTEEQKGLLHSVYEKHMATCGAELRKEFAIENITSVKWSEEENCIHIHWKDEWLHYYPDGTWS